MPNQGYILTSLHLNNSNNHSNQAVEVLCQILQDIAIGECEKIFILKNPLIQITPDIRSFSIYQVNLLTLSLRLWIQSQSTDYYHRIQSAYTTTNIHKNRTISQKLFHRIRVKLQLQLQPLDELSSIKLLNPNLLKMKILMKQLKLFIIKIYLSSTQMQCKLTFKNGIGQQIYLRQAISKNSLCNKLISKPCLWLVVQLVLFQMLQERIPDLTYFLSKKSPPKSKQKCNGKIFKGFPGRLAQLYFKDCEFHLVLVLRKKLAEKNCLTSFTRIQMALLIIKNLQQVQKCLKMIPQ
ncbi:unnamed protein product [Paramecium octaurelia]|uniref:Uncharacterized protein n=1 Tax=Paramecium octaurelia TaxID=43137 RepID=A0A8S1VQD2_PAROT|nr:unnamed protein product [Paramecium octaurelia]